MLFHCCEEPQHSLLLLCGSHKKNFLTSVRFASLPFSCYLNNQLTDIDFYLLSSFFTKPVTSRVELFAVVCSTHWDLSLSFFVLCFCLHTFSVLFLSVHLHYLYLFIGTSSQSVSKSMKSRHVSGDKSSKRWDEFTTTEQRTTTTSTDWVVKEDVRDFRCTSCVNLSTSFFNFRKRCEQ